MFIKIWITVLALVCLTTSASIDQLTLPTEITTGKNDQEAVITDQSTVPTQGDEDFQSDFAQDIAQDVACAHSMTLKDAMSGFGKIFKGFGV